MNKNWYGKVALACLVMLLISGSGQNPLAQTEQSDYLSDLPPLIDRELFFGDPEISSSRLSPDGKYVSFIKPYNDVRNIWIKGIDEPFDAAKAVTADERPVPAYFWSQDGRFLLYVQDKGGNENFHVYAVDPSAEPAGESGVPAARDLTPIEGIRAFIYAVPENKPGEMIVGLNDRDPAYHDVYRVDIATGERELLFENTQKVGFYVFDLEGNVRLAVRQMQDGGTEILRVDDDSLTQVYTCSWQESCFPVRFHKDGKRVYMETNKGEDVDLTRLVLFAPQTRELEVVESDPEGKVDFGSAVFSEDTDELIATVYVGDRVRIYPRDEQLKKDLEILRKELPEGELNLQSSTEDMQLHLVSISRDVDPGSVYLYNRKTGSVDLQYRSRPDLPSEHLAPMKAIRYKSRDGLEIPAYLTIPKGVEPKNLPTVIHPHGGPWARDNWGYDSYAQFLANRGYVVLQPNFRGSSGYGKEFLNAGNKEWGFGAMQHDITDGVNYLIEQGIADPERIGIFGGSYGGYATLAGVTFTPDLYAAAVPYVAPSNLITLIESFPAYWGPFIKIWHLRVGDPANPEDKADLIARSPLFKAEDIKTPMLVVHGANDPRVKKSESDQIVVALRERGMDVEYLVAPDEGHGFRAPENRLALAAAMEKFLAEQLGGRYQEKMSPEIEGQLAKLTVDVNTVELPDTTMAAYAETAPLPKRNAEKIQPMNLQYLSVMERGGQPMEMDVTRKVTRAEFNGKPVWSIVSVAQTPMGVGTDTFYIHQETLLPLKRSSVQGPVTISINYEAGSVKGEMNMGGQVTPVDLKLPSPILGDDAALEVTLAALPLAENYETAIRVFDLLQRKVKPMTLKVVGIETVQVEAGTFETYKVELKPIGGEPGGSTLYVAQTAPHFVVKSEAELPAMMGGGTLTSELQSTGDTTSK